MKALLDVNVLLDVVQNRRPHYAGSAAVLSAARMGEFAALIPLHAFTTVFYLVEKASSTSVANQTIDWLLQHFDVPAVDKGVLLRARTIPLKDFEDAVVASVAEKYSCEYIVSRNTEDFAGSPVVAMAPSDFLRLLRAFKSKPATT
jgi:predicted nucleic acid-binding protein